MRTRPLLALSATLCVVPALCAAQDARPLSEVKVDVVAEGKPVHEVLRELQRAHGLNYVVSQRVLEQAGLVNVQLRGVSLEDALHAITTACGLKLQIRGRILILLPDQPSPAVPAPVRHSARSEPAPAPGSAKSAAPKDFSARPRGPRPARGGATLPRAIGEVISVDVKTGHLVLDVDGLKLDFYAPSVEEAKDAAQAARMRATLARLEPGHKVALEYERIRAKFVIHSLVGGTKVRDQRLALVRKRDGQEVKERPAGTPLKPAAAEGGVSTPRNPLQAPEVVDAVPDGILAGTFVDFRGDVVRVKRGDGQVVSVYVPQHDPDLRAKIVVNLEALSEGAKVYFPYEGKDGRMVLQSTGLTVVTPKKKGK